MGLNEMFKRTADLKDLLESSLSAGLYVSKVVHGAFIKCDEIGTIAHAFSGKYCD